MLTSDFMESLNRIPGKVAFVPDLRKKRIKLPRFMNDCEIEKNTISANFSNAYPLAKAAQHLTFIYLSECHGFDHQTEERIRICPAEDASDLQRESDFSISVQINSIRHCRNNMYAFEVIASVNKDTLLPSKGVYLVVD